MINTVGIRFRNRGKIYTFHSNGISMEVGDCVVVETSKGMDFGYVATSPIEVFGSDEKELKPVIRIANQKDLKQVDDMAKREKEAELIFREKVIKHGLDMKTVGAEFAFDGSKLLFYFTSDGRVDFRNLVKDLASIFKTRIELRQIGVRDEARMIGGLGICGRPFCCSSFLDDFHPVSVKMAKNQEISLNPTKISGSCGRLMCCLKYEEDAYQDLIAHTPKVGTKVKVNGNMGVIVETHLISGLLKIHLEKDDEREMVIMHKDEVELIKRKNS